VFPGHQTFWATAELNHAGAPGSIVYAQNVDSLTWHGDLPHLRSPLLVCAFRGWNDAAASASTAIASIASSFDSELLAQVDPEDYFDFQTTRPTITLDEGQTRRLDWPANNLIAVRVPGADRDLVRLDGTEPNLRWRTFSETIATAADALGVEQVITLGALIAEVSHTLPVPITGLASDRQMVEELELERSNYEGPTGIVGVIHDLCRQGGIDSISLWAAVPHYVAAIPNPKAALALLRRLEGLTGIAVEASDLEEETTDYEEQISRAVAANPEIEELVSRIEAEQVDLLTGEGEELPSADSIAREFQRFLKQRGGDQS
jgi:proteasome assembly chaperone (PAC2) family protein